MADQTAGPVEIKPVEVTVIGGTGNGNTLQPGLVETAAHQPNIVVNVIPPAIALAVRFINTYLTFLVGLVSTALTSDVIPSKDFFDLLIKCAGLSVGAAGLDLLKNLVTIFGKLEGKYPLLTGNV